MQEMVKHRAILFPVETTARELLYKLFLATEFANKGHPVFIGAKEEIYRLLPVLRSYLYFDKGYQAGASEKLYAAIRQNEGLIVNLDEEGGVDYEDFSTISQRYPETLFEIADMIFLWGARQYDFLKKNRAKFDRSEVIVSGHPRFELLKPRFHLLYEKEVQRIKSRYGRYILFNTNMGFGNNIRGDAFVRRNYGGRIKNIDDVIAYDKKKVAAYISLIKRLSQITGKKIILRPHPEENKNTYAEAFSALPNAHVFYEGSVIPWILGSDVMVHPDCTTGIEAFMMGRQPVSFLPAADRAPVTELPVKVSVCFTDEMACAEYIAGEKHTLGGPVGHHPLLDAIFSFEKGSSEIIVNATHRLSARSSPSAAIGSAIPPGTVIMRRFISVGRRLLKRGDPLMKNKRTGLDYGNIVNAVAAIHDTARSAAQIRVKKIWKNLFYIRNSETRMDKIKIFCTYKFVDKPWGGANNFIRALYKSMVDDGRFEFAESIDDNYDILFMNQRSLGPVNESKKIGLKEIKRAIDAKNRKPKIIVRVINLQMHAYPPRFLRGLLTAYFSDRETINLLNFADHVIFQSSYQYGFFKKAGFSGTTYSIIHNGADVKFVDSSERPALHENGLCLVSATTGTRKTKRHELIAAFSELPGVRVLHAGAWPENVPVKKVLLQGTLETEAMKTLYRQCHYFLHPAIKDPCPNVIFEALCAGLPVIYNPDRGSSAEIVRENGIAINEKSLETTIAQAFGQYGTLVANVKKNKPYYTISRAAQEYINVFSTIHQLVFHH